MARGFKVVGRAVVSDKNDFAPEPGRNFYSGRLNYLGGFVKTKLSPEQFQQLPENVEIDFEGVVGGDRKGTVVELTSIKPAAKAA